MSESTPEARSVTEPPPGDERVDQGPSSVDGVDPTGTEETIEEAIARLEAAFAEARTEKEEADRTFADADGRLTALRNLKRDSETATLAYEKVHDQLTIDQQGYLDYNETEDDSLVKLLGPRAVAEVEEKVEAATAAHDEAVEAVEAAKAALAAAERRRDDSRSVVKERSDRVARYKQLPATIGARHARLKSMRDEVVKARQAGQYALAYWLLVCRDFRSVLDEASQELIEPEELPGRLLAAVNEVADAERDHAKHESTVTKRRNELAEAERRLADLKANGEARLRDQLKQISPAGS